MRDQPMFSTEARPGPQQEVGQFSLELNEIWAPCKSSGQPKGPESDSRAPLGFGLFSPSGEVLDRSIPDTVDALTRHAAINENNRDQLQSMFEVLRGLDADVAALGGPDYSATSEYLDAVNENLRRCGLVLTYNNSSDALSEANRENARRGDPFHKVEGVLQLRSTISGQALGESVFVTSRREERSA